MSNTRTIEVDGRTSINDLVFLEDDKHLLSGGEDGTIRQWRVEDGREIQDQRLTVTVAGGTVRAIALSGDGNWIVGTGWPVTTVWNRRTRQIARTMSEHTNWVNAVDVSPDSTRFATGSDDGKAIIWNMSSGERTRPGLPHDAAIVSVRFSPNGDRLAVAVWSRALHIYNAQTGDLLRTIVVGVYRSSAIVWSNNSQHIFALATGNVLKRIDIDAHTFLSEWTVPGEAGGNWSTIALPRHGRFIAAFVGLSLTFWDTSTRAQVGPVLDHRPQVPRLRSMALSSGNNYIATASDNGVIIIRTLNDIIPMSYIVGRDVLPQTACRADLYPQIGALRGILRALESHCGESSDAQEVTPQGIPGGTYRIKNRTGDLYLTGPEAGAGNVVAQPLDESSVFQMWTIALDVDGAYHIVNNSQWLTVGVGAPLLAGQEGTTWTFEPRGDTYVVGNAANAMAIQIEQNSRSVSVLLRNNSPSQRWVLERLMV